MSTIPQGIICKNGTIIQALSFVAGTNCDVTSSGTSYNIEFTGTPPRGTILQTFTISLTNSFVPINAFSSTYSSANLFTSLQLTTLSANSEVTIAPKVQCIVENGVSIGFWINGAGAPIGVSANSTSSSVQTYGLFSDAAAYKNTVFGQPITVDACAFYSPATASNSNNRILGSSDGFSYSGQLTSTIIVSEVQL